MVCRMATFKAENSSQIWNICFAAWKKLRWTRFFATI